ncbi:PREDICTED: ATP-dependent RNA helicase DDX42 [Wasmannia auropunctata]|uniref:ATP-dependent RNA helicase DDX42 n=1 Tax=Wasmannia auropunctata TaxID=64793 RepID=UPI0005EF5DD3|nr:PREDICTED: ATP-dependent RNA helicase DDX42 [Wasmannia auropunctata]XP_011701674.1 PREDICTED: ATP-dependent RNA helicase DDX42 [Wasmannia auropunctata]XP_011701675.1 PREDICTED: ATP-dependent RNA helicase DDX42 [Wasmannia auropunctata]XP_011701676.1 PREDICTED: ATP-dependent RNA helicase DDX42 [Wasmannia auropunctata]XP_011701677.1 PREDICTED: ATP-dependent RNA helicase DDX42 [Wasmannia auropunctata]
MSYHRGSGSKPKGFGFTGFQMSGTKRSGTNIPPPPPNSTLSKQGYHTMNAITENALSACWGMPKKRSKTEEEYFEDDDEAATSSLEYIPAPGSPTYDLMKKSATKNDSDSEEDTLDAFMAGIDAEVKRNDCAAQSGDNRKEEKSKGFRADIDGEDDEESYYRYMEENPTAGLQQEESDQEIEYDEDGNPIAPPKKKEIDPLPPIDHSEIEYEPFEKNFYNVHEEIASLSKQQIDDLKKTLGIKVSGPSPPNPVTSFGHFGFDDALIKTIRKNEYTQPTPIQAQAVPAALSGRDIIGIAKTGSGKTAAFIWPMLVHIMDQRELKAGDGPIGLILAPTRELSQQIYQEAKKFGKVYNIQVCCCYGGGSKWEQSKALESGAEIVVATPGRMIDLVKMKATNLARVTFLVLDEADRMFDMGFEPQVRSICNHVRPDRQTLLFSATFKKKVEKLARDVLTDPIRIVQGDVGEANTDVTQHVIMFHNNPSGKWNWLLQNLVEFLSAGSLLIFVTKKLNAEELANNLKLKEFDVLLLHGDMDQIERNKVITAFKKKDVSTLVATDVAARGLDIPHIKTVVNYDVSRDIDTHTHRIGRTGRAGEKGTAYTLVTEKDKEFAGHLVRNLEGANQEVPKSLMDLAMQSAWFRKSRFKGGKGKSLNVGGAGLGFRGRPNSSNSSGSTSQASKDISEVVKKLERHGPGSDRLSAMKAAFRSQYNSQFRASSDHTWEQTITPPSVIMPPPPAVPSPKPAAPENQAANSSGPERKRVRKSRWE